MIVVIGSPIGRSVDGVVAAGGMASRVALAVSAAGSAVQLVGKTGDDPTADGVVLDLARGGVGHVALLRDPAWATPLESPPTDEEPLDGTDRPGDDAAERVETVTPVGNQASGPVLEAADVDLGLRYLTDFAVVVLAEPVAAEIVTIVSDAARWGGARMVLVVDMGQTVHDDLPTDVVVFEAPEADTDGVFATMVGTFAAALDRGMDPGEAFRASIASDGWTGTGTG